MSDLLTARLELALELPERALMIACGGSQLVRGMVVREALRQLREEHERPSGLRLLEAWKDGTLDR